MWCSHARGWWGSGLRLAGRFLPPIFAIAPMPLKHDAAHQRQKNSLHFGNSGCRLLFGRCRVGIYAHAVSGCLGAQNAWATSAHPTVAGRFLPSAFAIAPMPLMCDAAYQRLKSSLHFGNSGAGCFLGDVGWAFMPTRFQAALGHRTRGQRVPTLRLLF